MPTHLRTTLLVGTLAFVGVVALPLRAASDTGHLMALTVEVHQTMAGAPALPPHTFVRQVCTRPGTFDAKAFVREQSQTGCQLENYSRKGNEVSFDEVCTGAESSTSHGTFQLTDGADFTGDMHTAFTAAGHAVTVDTHYTGKALGTCKYVPPTSG
ncbi:MAG TPA: DUF3617 family protein [Rhodanobacteraceae bacterium]|nr:DUF3617 family protein [Rhodanobacteraceae bacterium]